MGNNKELVEHLIDGKVLKTPAIIDAFYAIDRGDFVPWDLMSEAYIDTALPIGWKQTISQPFTVAFMLELLQPKAGDRILDIGSGSGWQTALLAHIVGSYGHVTALEIIPELQAWGQTNVERYSFIQQGIVAMHAADGFTGYPAQAPYDGIIAAASAETIPLAWQRQLKIGGRLVMPLESSIVLYIKRSATTWDKQEYPGFVFVPFVHRGPGEEI